LKAAIELYDKAWQANPKFYSAPLFAGDAEYKLGNYDEAGVWFARAIAIDSDLETAHRYWADCLVKAGKPLEARKQYLEAFIGDPYQKAPRLSLRAWADANHMRYIPPAISLPAPATTDKDGHINITIAMPAKDDPLSSVWLMYSLGAAVWRGDKFKQTYPNEKTYRHSLAEEMDAIHMLLTGLKEQKIPDSKLTPTLHNLIALDKDGMLECWILLDNPDNGTAQDYVAFRAMHRDLLRAYVEKYDLHPA